MKGTCQICGKQFKLKNGKLPTHGDMIASLGYGKSAPAAWVMNADYETLDAEITEERCGVCDGSGYEN